MVYFRQFLWVQGVPHRKAFSNPSRDPQRKGELYEEPPPGGLKIK